VGYKSGSYTALLEVYVTLARIDSFLKERNNAAETTFTANVV